MKQKHKYSTDKGAQSRHNHNYRWADRQYVVVAAKAATIAAVEAVSVAVAVVALSVF